MADERPLLLLALRDMHSAEHEAIFDLKMALKHIWRRYGLRVEVIVDLPPGASVSEVMAAVAAALEKGL